MHGIDRLAPRVAMMILVDDVGCTSEGPAQMIPLRRRSTWTLARIWLLAGTFAFCLRERTPWTQRPRLLIVYTELVLIIIEEAGQNNACLVDRGYRRFSGQFGRFETLSLSILQPLFMKQRFAWLAYTLVHKQPTSQLDPHQPSRSTN
jgi:hypothetical protein